MVFLNLFASCIVNPLICGSITICINTSCVSATPHLSFKYFSNKCCSSSVNWCARISLYHNSGAVLNLTYLSNGSSPSPINLITEFAMANSFNECGRICLMAWLPTLVSNWNKLLIIPFDAISHISSSV